MSAIWALLHVSWHISVSISFLVVNLYHQSVVDVFRICWYGMGHQMLIFNFMEWDIRDEMHGLVCFCLFDPESVATIWCGSNFTTSYSNLHVSKDGIRTAFLTEKAANMSNWAFKNHTRRIWNLKVEDERESQKTFDFENCQSIEVRNKILFNAVEHGVIMLCWLMWFYVHLTPSEFSISSIIYHIYMILKLGFSVFFQMPDTFFSPSGFGYWWRRWWGPTGSGSALFCCADWHMWNR